MYTTATSNRSRPVLVNRTNSDDLNDMAVDGRKKIRRVLKGSKKSNNTTKQQQQQQPVAAVVQYVSSSAHSGARRRATLPTARSDASCSESDDVSSHNKNNDNNSNNKSISWEHGWLKDDSLTKTCVYYHRMNRPITLLQAVVRGQLARIHFRKARIRQLEAEILDIQNMAARRIQTRVRWNQERQRRHLHAAARYIQARVRLIQARAITPLQAVCRGWIARLQFKVLVLEHQLVAIHANHERDIRGIQHHQKVEMRRVDSEYKVIAGKENKRQSKVLEATTGDIYALRHENRELRNQNETMQKAAIIMATKNVQTNELMTLHQVNFKELQTTHVPQFERDHEQISMVSDDYLERIQRYKEALEMRQEHMCFERKVTKCLIQTINIMLKNIDAKCQDVALKNAILDQARETLKGTTNINRNNKREDDCS